LSSKQALWNITSILNIAGCYYGVGASDFLSTCNPILAAVVMNNFRGANILCCMFLLIVGCNTLPQHPPSQLHTIVAALAAYHSANRGFPKQLSDLAPAYLSWQDWQKSLKGKAFYRSVSSSKYELIYQEQNWECYYDTGELKSLRHRPW
jgi:hypothetical protein